MTYKKDRTEFTQLMVNEGVPVETANKIMRYSNTLHRIAIEDCNRELTESDIKARKRAESALHTLLAGQMGTQTDFKFKVGGDPRGVYVRVIVPSGKSNCFDGTGIAVPTDTRIR
jgi:hypothetical protein